MRRGAVGTEDSLRERPIGPASEEEENALANGGANTTIIPAVAIAGNFMSAFLVKGGRRVGGLRIAVGISVTRKLVVSENVES
jgi:hypothetical protein